MSSRKWLVCRVTLSAEQIELILDHGMEKQPPITVERTYTSEEDTIRNSE